MKEERQSLLASHFCIQLLQDGSHLLSRTFHSRLFSTAHWAPVSRKGLLTWLTPPQFVHSTEGSSLHQNLLSPSCLLLFKPCPILSAHLETSVLFIHNFPSCYFTYSAKKPPYWGEGKRHEVPYKISKYLQTKKLTEILPITKQDPHTVN